MTAGGTREQDVLAQADDVRAEDARPAFFALTSELAATYSRTGEVRTVAVVGNQPLGVDPERAAMIDSCDLVVRVNGFRLDEPNGPPSVGRRCEVIVFNRGVRATPWFFEGYRDRLYLMIEPGRLHREADRYPAWWPTDLGFVTVPNREVTIPMNTEMGMDAEHGATWATTGGTAIWLAGTLFPEAELHITGFSFLEHPDQTAWDHAYGDSCIVGGEHSLSNESRWLAGWVGSGRAIVHR
jgi:hypothetical protein